MQRIVAGFILSLSFAFYLQPAQAKKRPDPDLTIQMPKVDIQSPKMTPVAEEALKALGNMFDARDGLKDCHIEYRSVTDQYDEAGHMYPYTTLVSGDLQKPNKMSLRLSHGAEYLGQIVSDGVTVTYYNAKTKSYAQFPAPAKYDIEDTLSENAEKKLKEVEADLKAGKKAGENPIPEPTSQQQAEIDAVSVFGPIDNPEIRAKEAATFLLRKSTKTEAEAIFLLLGDVKHTKSTLPVSNHSAEIVDLSIKTTATSMHGKKKEISWSITQMHFAFDSVSALPIEWRLALTSAIFSGVSPSTTRMFDFKFDKIAPTAAPLPAETFTWAIPDGAKLYHKPKEADPFVNSPK